MVVDQLQKRDITEPHLLEVMRRVPRHLFLPPGLADVAYDDCPQPIGLGQTMSQPYIVASMSQHLELHQEDNVLEIGTGSAYQTAVLAEMVNTVYTAEIIPELFEQSSRLLNSLGYTNVHSRYGDGLLAWAEAAPFNAIIVTAAAPVVPQDLLDQLADGGRMVIPVNCPETYSQELLLFQKGPTGVIKKHLYPVRFVPLVRVKRGTI